MTAEVRWMTSGDSAGKEALPWYRWINNIVEQDHRRIKFRLQPMLSFKSFCSARRVIVGNELMRMIPKCQFFIPHL
jgi:transposase-like protein